MVEQCKDPSQNKEWEVEFKPGEKEIESRGNKRPGNSERVEFTGLLLPLDPISFSPGLNSTFLLFTGPL